MPLPERVIQPVNVSRGTLQYQVPDELEGVTNGTLANIIRQLSSLSRHAEEIFGSLFGEAETIGARCSNLQAKIDRLSIRVTKLDSTVEEVSLQEIQTRKVFQSWQAFDQQVVSRETMPKAMQEAYVACDRPPPLDKLNPYREDGKDGLKFYTDPTYFFELWRQEMLKDTERMMHDRGKKHGSGSSAKIDNGEGVNVSSSGGIRQKKRVRQPHNTAERHRQKAVGGGEYIIDPSAGIDQNYIQMSMQHHEYFNHQPYSGGFSMEQQNFIARPNSIEVSRSYPDHQLPMKNNGLLNAEPIYTPRVLLNNSSHDQPPSPRYNANNQLNIRPRQEQHFSPEYGIQPQESPTGSPSRGFQQKRPSQPPPAPPPGGMMSPACTPTRGGSVQRESLPPPPPPPISEAQNGGVPLVTASMSHYSNNSIITNSGDLTDLLPPPPPVPESSASLGVRAPIEHLPPSPPPPPPVDPPLGPTLGAVPPPPPPPPPTNGLTNGSGLTNGDMYNNKVNESAIKLSPIKTDGSPKSILSPQISALNVKKPVPPQHLMVHDGVRSDLLKAIRDGIALKKVEQREKSKNEKDGCTGQGDVASILARRVAVEMSDSDDAGGHSDSEYDSDDWGDESTA